MKITKLIHKKKIKLCQTFSENSIHEGTNAFASEMDKIKSLKELSPFTQQSSISEPTEQFVAHATETKLAKHSNYEFYDDNGEKFVFDNAEFEEEEKELIDIFNSNLAK
ncbi:hypothetical protein TNCV_2258291 [Trichonephila clavipes]|nr:hypothetical protein TNCV_2258291 [Trichonephila clavipes]